tara:strand:- start:334 stop:609 length:276 start_codon:yes stop_codon:yes gene_type:complete
MRDSHAAAEQAMMEQIEGLKQIHADEIAEREKALQKYKEKIIEIEERYINAQDEIERLSQEERQEFVKDFSQNKQNLIDAITQRYGFTYVP